jgi:hypothetical protein
MGKLDSVVRNFANHVISGLSGFIVDAHDACSRASLTAVDLQLLPEVQLPQPLQNDAQFRATAGLLRAKFAEILAKEAGVTLDLVSSLAIQIDFLPDESLVQKRQGTMKQARAHYGYNPIYRCMVLMRDLSGKEREVTLEDVD